MVEMYAETEPVITPLGYALLCEIRKESRGGYALRRLFETTPLGLFSSSPGSIYPALKRLEQQGLVRAIGSGRGGRFEITAPGTAHVDTWLARPVSVAEVANALDLCLLRFAFLDAHPDRTIPAAFLASLSAAATTRAEELRAFLTSEQGTALPALGRMAVDHGLRSILATRAWADDALAEIKPKSHGEHA